MTDAALLLIHLENDAERDLLRHQRVICGWKSHDLDDWREQLRRGERTMFWICVPWDLTAAQDNTAHDELHISSLTYAPLAIARPPVYSSPSIAYGKGGVVSFNPVGHVSLDRLDHDHRPPDFTLADPSLSMLTITTLFVHPAYAGTRLATFGMKACEYLAQREPFGSSACRAITINTVVRRPPSTENGRRPRGWVDTDGKQLDEWIGDDGQNLWEVLGGKRPAKKKRWDLGAWYERLGFVPFKEIPFEYDEDDAKWVYYRKELGSPSSGK